MPKRDTIIGAVALTISIGAVILAIFYKGYLTSIANFGEYSLIGIFIVSLVAASFISVTFIPIPYYLPVFFLSNTLAPEWELLAPVLVSTVSAIGASIGEIPTFMIGYGGKTISERLASRFSERLYRRILEWTKRHGSVAVFLISATINPLHLPLTIAVGALRFAPWKWAIFTVLGNLFKNLVIAFAGYFALNRVM